MWNLPIDKEDSLYKSIDKMHDDYGIYLTENQKKKLFHLICLLWCDKFTAYNLLCHVDWDFDLALETLKKTRLDYFKPTNNFILAIKVKSDWSRLSFNKISEILADCDWDLSRAEYYLDKAEEELKESLDDKPSIDLNKYDKSKISIEEDEREIRIIIKK